LLCLTSEEQWRDRLVAPGFTELAVPKTAEHRAEEARALHDSTVSVGDLIAAEFCTRNPEFVAAFRMLAVRASAVIFEHPYLSPLIDLLPPGVRIVYSALNVESELKAVTLRPRRDAARRIAQTIELEQRLLDRADVIVCVSEAD